MPKMKTHRASKKRFRVTKNGKLMRMKEGRSHLRRNKRRTAVLRRSIPSDNKTLTKQVVHLVADETK